jgi:hypothetical protein
MQQTTIRTVFSHFPSPSNIVESYKEAARGVLYFGPNPYGISSSVGVTKTDL